MKLVTFRRGREYRLGAVQHESVIDIAAAIGFLKERKAPPSLARESWFKRAAETVLKAGSPPPDMVSLLKRGETWRAALAKVLEALAASLRPSRAPRGLLISLSKARLCAPILRPAKITCVGLNYESHTREQAKEPPGKPVFFLKSHNTICGPGDPILLPPNSTQVDYEAEFAVVIGKRGKQIPEEKAYEHVAGYFILNDVSARDMQVGDRQWFRGKSCDTFAPTGPWIVTPDEIPAPHNLRISLTLNGEIMQDSNTSDLVFRVPYLISYLSQSLTWEPGDILSTGTPGGVGYHRKPQIFLKPGDTVSVSVERIGTLTNPVVGP